MHTDMLLLAERLVVAMERMSQDVSSISLLMGSMGQDVRNLSAYVYDLSNSVSHFLDKERERNDISVVHCNGDSFQNNAPAAGHELSTECKYSSQSEQADGISVPLSEDLEHKKISVADISANSHSEGGNVFSSADNSVCNRAINVKEQSNNEENGKSSGIPITFGNRQYSETDVAVEVKQEVDTSENWLLQEGCNIHVPTISSQNKTQTPCAVPSCSSVDNSMGQEEAAEMYLWKGDVKQQLAGVRQMHHMEEMMVWNCSPGERDLRRCDSLESSSLQRAKEGARRAFECFICKKAFVSHSHLIVHMRVHTGERPHKCSRCEKSFRQSGDLTKHMLIHTGERPYKCSQCGKAFRQSSILSAHMLTHVNERIFKCTQCVKTFKSKGNLKSHMRIHIAERPFKCSWCEKAFYQNCNLIVHMRIHTGEKPFKCTQCGKGFYSSGKLTLHKRTHMK